MASSSPVLLLLLLAAALLLLAVAIRPSHGAVAADKITSLPNYNHPIPFNQYSGYITVDPVHGRALFYWFVESQRSPSTDPVVMWLNGGPGCSSLDGFFYEHGPFHFDREPGTINTTLHANPYAWNNVSNVLYVEAPAGVGFSYSNTSSDYITNDNKTAIDNYQFLVNWFAAYPEYAGNDFYISGESYAGIYVPTLAYTVHQNNQNSKNPKINLKGILVGNGVTDETYDAVSFTQFAYNHALYSPSLYAQIQANGCLTSNSGKCLVLLGEMYQQIGNVNIYDIYKQCYNGPPGFDKFTYDPLQPASRLPHMRNLKAEVPCINSAAATEYLNDDNVRAAIHALPQSKIGSWSICSNKVQYHKLYNSVLAAYQVLTTNYRVLFYSGDVDGSVSYVGSIGWLAAFEKNGKPDNDWVSWNVDKQIAGYFTTYSKPYPITFTTVKGAGHMVPQYKPPQAYAMFSGFLAGTWPPRR